MARPLEGIIADSWNNFEDKALVHYISGKNTNGTYLRKLIREINPDIIFANGLYSLPFSIIPVFLSSCTTVLSVRGMLHPGALSQKRLKKELFLLVFKLLRLHKKVIFHATDITEEGFIRKKFGAGIRVGVAGNFPHVHDYTCTPTKTVGSLILGSIGLISPMKNHHLVLEALHNCTGNISYFIYGPIKDEDYWQQCLLFIKGLPPNVSVTYKGEVPPTEINEKFKEFHYSILPSKSENFGHAIYEGLTAGRPCITSFFTPWNHLEDNHAGYNVDISDVTTITRAIDQAARQNEGDYICWCKSARSYAISSVNTDQLQNQYRALFLHNAT
jgi:glycosyltransferase involved in cell wall biosynthesis